jgi:hypothetical protein
MFDNNHGFFFALSCYHSVRYFSSVRIENFPLCTKILTNNSNFNSCLPLFQMNNILCCSCCCCWSNNKNAQDVNLRNNSVQMPRTITQQPKVEEIIIRDVVHTNFCVRIYWDDCFVLLNFSCFCFLCRIRT